MATRMAHKGTTNISSIPTLRNNQPMTALEMTGVSEQHQSGTGYGAAKGDTYRVKKCGPAPGHSEDGSGAWRTHCEA